MANIDSVEPFFITGGTLPRDATCYVERQADRDLYAALRRGEFCYLLTARQMGKSSLMVRTAARLRDAGVRVAVLDLTAVGSGASPEQFYRGLLERLGRQLRLSDALEARWRHHADLAPLQRWLSALRDAALEPAADGQEPAPLVLFVDEIDLVRSLAFGTAELFAGIRACYNERAFDPAYRHLTFCLLGVATPSDLIDDPHLTPFNIGRRIELADFVPTEAQPLATGLGEGVGCRVSGVGDTDPTSPLSPYANSDTVSPASPTYTLHPTPDTLLFRILYWTNGHPYLTQRLCRAVAEITLQNPKSEIQNSDVDAACERLFLTRQARQEESNLVFVSDRLLNGDHDRVTALEMYRKIREGGRVPDNNVDPVVTALKLAGIVRSEEGRLVVRNRIYAHVFDRYWIARAMPEAEVCRQRIAYWRGVIRTATLASIIVFTVWALAIKATNEARHAERNRRVAVQAARTSEVERRKAGDALREADGFAALREWTVGNTDQTAKIVEAQRKEWNESNQPTWLWRYLWGLIHQDAATLSAHTNLVFALDVSPGSPSRWIASAGFDGRIIVWDRRYLHPVKTLDAPFGWACSVTFSPNGRWLAAGGGYETRDGWIRVWDTATWTPLVDLPRQPYAVLALAFSRDGRSLAGGSARYSNGSLQIWNTETWTPRWTTALPDAVGSGRSLAFSPDGEQLYIGATRLDVGRADPGTRLRIRESRTGRKVRDIPCQDLRWIGCLALSPDGKQLVASGYPYGNIYWWDTASVRLLDTAHSHAKQMVSSLAFSANGRRLASVGWDGTVRLWNVPSRTEVRVFRGHREKANTVAFLPSGHLVSGGNDNTLRIWDASVPERTTLPISPSAIVALSPYGSRLYAVQRKGLLGIWDLKRWNWAAETAQIDPTTWSMTASRDGRLLAISSARSGISIWATNPLRKRCDLATHMEASPKQVAFVSQNSRLITADKRVQAWDTATGRLLQQSAPLTPGLLLALSPDERRLAIAWNDRNLPIYLIDPEHVDIVDWDTARQLQDVPSNDGHTNTISGLVFSPDGSQLVSSGLDGQLIFWDLAHASHTTRRADVNMVDDVVPLDGGRTLVTLGRDPWIRLWDTATRRNIAIFERLSSERNPAGQLFSHPFGSRFISLGHHSLHVWTAPTFAEIQQREQQDARLAAGDDKVTR